MNSIIIRKAVPKDADTLTDIALRSKAHWGYSKKLIEAWRPELTVTSELIEKSISYVAENKLKIVGFWIRAAIQSDEPTPGLFFVEPDYIGQGIGKLLWKAVRKEAVKRRLKYFTIEADPNAAPIYIALGGIKVGEKESTVVPGRMLPIIRFELNG